MIATKIGICFCIQGEPGLNGVKGLKGEPGQKGDRGPLGLPVSKENFPFQCKSQTFLSTLSNNSGLLGNYLTVEISIIGEHIMLVQSPAQFRSLMSALLSEEDPVTHHTISIVSLNYKHAYLPFLKLTILLPSASPLKQDCADYVIISPKSFDDLVQFKILPRFFFSFDTQTVALYWWQACNWPLSMA